MKLTWNPPAKIPKLFNHSGKVVFPHKCGTSTTISYDVSQSKDILLRFRHNDTHYRLGNEGWKNYPDTQAGKYKYEIGVYRIYDDGSVGFESSNGHECEPDEWAYLPKCVDVGYTW